MMKNLPIKLISVFVLIIAGYFYTSATQNNNIQTEETVPYKASMDGWEVNLDSAYAISKKTGKPILANFTGTDWCGWCIKLKGEVFTTQKFKDWAKDNVVLLEIDFPRRFKLPEDIANQNRQLQQAFGVQGYPTLWVFNIDAVPNSTQKSIKGLAKTGYVAGGPDKWIKDLEAKLATNKAE